MPEPFNLNLRHLGALGVIARSGSMNAAAAGAGISQPALTQGLAKLEASLGASLFDRRPGGMSPTASGLVMIDRADAAFAHLAAGTRPGPRGFARPERLMTSTQLRAFQALTDSGSFVGAAQATGLSQPALHRATRDLEQVTGTALVERRGRGVALTLDGHRLARAIRLAAAEIATGIAEAGSGGCESGRITIGAMPLSRALLLPRAVARHAIAMPGVTFSIIEGSWRELVDSLRDGVIDMMVGALRPAGIPDLDQAPLYEDHLVVAGRTDHPLAGPGDAAFDALRAYPWIVGPAGSPLRAEWDRMFAGDAPPPRPIECGSVMMIRGLLSGADFLTLVSPAQIALEVSSGVLAHVGGPIGDSVRTIGVTTRRGWRPGSAQRRFLAHLGNAAEELSSGL